jgi:alpha-amylase
MAHHRKDGGAGEFDGSSGAATKEGNQRGAMRMALAACLACLLATGRAEGAEGAESWRTQVLYLVVVDRFRDGDPGNNRATHCFDLANPRRYHGGDLAGLRQNLAYVRDLGATAIWITPPNMQAGPDPCGGYHGYWIDYTDPDDGAIEPELGTAVDLAALVTDMHGAKMRFVLDVVVNHAGDRARVVREHPAWFHDPANCAAKGPAEVSCPLAGHPDFAQEEAPVAAYLSSFAARAVSRYGVDGIRMDTAKHVLPAYFEASFLPAVRKARPGIFTVAEIFEGGSTATFLPYLNAGFDSAFHYPLYGALADGIGRGGSVDRIAQAVADGVATVGPERALDLVLFVDNHDVPRFASLPGPGVPESEVRARLLLGLDLIFTLPGIPQLYYGDEIGMYGGADPDNRRDLPAWAMDPTARALSHPGAAVPGAATVYARVQKLSALRRTVPAFAEGAYRELWRQNGATNPNVFAFMRGEGGDSGVRVVALSADSRPTDGLAIPVPGIADGTVLVDELGDGAKGTATIAEGKLRVNLPPRSAAIYRVLRDALTTRARGQQ